MSKTSIGAVDTTNMQNITYNNSAGKGEQSFDYDVTPATQENLWFSPEWLKWKGYYDSVPELQSVIDKKAVWTVGKGFKADTRTKKILNKIRGCGIDSFNTIMQNLVRTYTIGGDAFAEIMKNRRGDIINLKPLSPENIKIIANDKGIITKYEYNISSSQTSGINKKIRKTITFKPSEIFHLSWMRLGDAIHGIGTIAKLGLIIKARNEAMRDLKVVFHRYVKPLWVFSVDTDDTNEIAAFKVKVDKAVENAENLIVPKDTVDNIERISIPQYSTLDPLPWLKSLQKYFIIAEGVPEVVLGSGESVTEASAKIMYLAFQQMVEYNQLFLEEQLKNQLNLKVEFEFPARIDEDVRKDEKKDGPIQGEKKSEVKV